MKSLLKYIKESISRNYKHGLFDIEDNITDVTGGLREMLVNWLINNTIVNTKNPMTEDMADDALSKEPAEDGETYILNLGNAYTTFTDNPPVPLRIESTGSIEFKGNFNPTNISTQSGTRAAVFENNYIEEMVQNGFVISSIHDVDEVDMSRIGSALETPEISNIKRLKWGQFKPKYSLSWINIRECDIIDLKYLKNVGSTVLTFTNIDKIVGLEHINSKNMSIYIEGVNQELEIGPDVVLQEITLTDCNKITGMNNLTANECSLGNYSTLQSFDELPYKCAFYTSNVPFLSNMDIKELKKLGKSHKLRPFYVNNKKIL